MENKQDQRFQKTQQRILDAFKQMIIEQNLDAINVKTLTEKAGIHRKTFYLHFQDIEELYSYAILQITQEYASEVSKLPQPYRYSDLTRILFEFFTRDEYTELLYCSPMYDSFMSKIMQINLENNRSRNNPYVNYSQKEQNIINAFVTTSSLSAFRQWVQDGKEIPMNRAIFIVSQLLEDGVNTITKKSSHD